MAPSHPVVGVRMLHTSRVTNLSQVLIIASPIHNGSTSGHVPSLPLRCLPSTSRRFWWGRNGYINKSSSNHANYHKCLEAHQRIIKYRSSRGTEQPSQRSKEYLLDSQYRITQGWRLLNSWSKPNRRLQEATQLPKDKDNNNGEVEREKQWKAEYQKRQEEIASRFEELRRRVAEDPYAVLFGRTLQRGVWHPWTPYESENPPKPKDQPSNNGKDLPADKTSESLDRARIGLRVSPSTKKTTPYSAPVSSEASPSASRETKPEASTVIEEYEIDPISMRKVPRKRHNPVSSLETTNATSPKETPLERTVQPTERKVKIYPEQSKEPSSSTVDMEMNSSNGALSGYAKFWLEKEGFGTRNIQSADAINTPVAKNTKLSIASKSNNKIIESSLDRHLRNTSEGKPTDSNKTVSLVYRINERKEEDIDLLRASDVRATSGLAKRPTTESADKKFERRSKLEDDFRARHTQSADSQYGKEISVHRANTSRLHKPSGTSDAEPRTSAMPKASYLTERISHDSPATKVDSQLQDAKLQSPEISHQSKLENEIQNEENNSYAHETKLPQTITEYVEIRSRRKDLEKQAARLEEQHVKKLQLIRQEQDRLTQQEIKEIQHREEGKRKAAEALLAKEISAQKAAMEAIQNRRYERSLPNSKSPSIQLGEGDMSANVHEFVNRDRWYKKKAPHAIEQELQLQNKRAEQQTRDKALVCELRGIYEDTYGVIDTKHRQPANPCIKNAEDEAIQNGPQASCQSQDHTSNESTKLRDDRFTLIRRIIGEARAGDSSRSSTRASASVEPQHDKIVRETAEPTLALDQTTDVDSTKQGKLELASSKTIGIDEFSPKADSLSHTTEGLSFQNFKLPELKQEHREKRLQNRQQLNMLLERSEHNMNLLSIIQKRVKHCEENFTELSFKVQNLLNFTRDIPKNNPPSPLTQSTSSSIPGTLTSKRNTYKILALDYKSQEVTCANTTSSLFETSSPPRSASAILSHLAEPAKYIPHLEYLEGTSFELVAGNRKMLVFKLVNGTAEGKMDTNSTKPQLGTRSSTPASTSDDPKVSVTNSKSDTNPTKRIVINVILDKPEHAVQTLEKNSPTKTETLEVIDSAKKSPHTNYERGSDSFTGKQPVNPIDGTTSRFASPTGFVNHDAVFPLPTKQSPGERVRREEDVFSGSSRNRWSEEEPIGSSVKKAGKERKVYKRSGKIRKFFRELKRLFLTASFVAAFCYLLGVLQSVYKTRARDADRRSWHWF